MSYYNISDKDWPTLEEIEEGSVDPGNLFEDRLCFHTYPSTTVAMIHEFVKLNHLQILKVEDKLQQEQDPKEMKNLRSKLKTLKEALVVKLNLINSKE